LTMARHQSSGARCMRTVFLFALLLSATVAVTAEEAQAEGTPAPEATEATPTEAPVEELPPLDCKPNELLEKLDSWSVDCVAMWLENLGFPELRGAFTGNKIDGVALKALTMEKLADDYGVSDEDQRKKIYYNLKDALRKDSSSGNTNHYSEMLFWILPFLGIYKWLSLKYDKQIARAMKRYKKWQEARNPPKPVETVVYADGTNEWITGVNGDVGKQPKEKKEKKPPGDKKKKAAKVE